jgi:hypothetical protein
VGGLDRRTKEERREEGREGAEREREKEGWMKRERAKKYLCII